ncbi:hypothetical protein GCM10028808_54750 [Spirosoma migulaei]
MIFLSIFVAFWAGYLARIVQQIIHNQYDTYQEEKIELAYTKRLCRLTDQMNRSLHLNVALLEEKKQLQQRLRELQDQHERTLAALN